MNAATITQAQDKGHFFSGLFAAIGNFSEQLFAAQGGWLASRQARARQASDVVAERAELFALAASADRHSPNLAAELRWLANR